MAALDKFTGTLGAKNAAHLLRRATFGATAAQIETFAGYTIDQALDVLFAAQAVPAPPIDPQTGSTWLNPAATGANSEQTDLTDFYMAWHVEQMRKSGTSIKERLVYFMHIHLPTKRSLVERSESLYYQNKLYRYYALGSFKTMFRKLIVDNAMLLFLDNATNDVASPNENFAREMFELYSIGRGTQVGEGDYTNYTEDDIKAATRVLTGYATDETYASLDAETNIPSGKLKTTDNGGTVVANRHDPGTKQFSAHFQNTIIAPSALSGGYATEVAAKAELDEMIDMIFDQNATAQFITRKIYRFFMYYQTPDEVETAVIVPLAAQFKSSGYSMVTLVRGLLQSQHFFDTDNALVTDNNRGAIIKSPLEIILGTCNLFAITFPSDPANLYQTVYQMGLLDAMYKQGISFYEPYDVDGYPAYAQFPIYNRAWITPYSMAYRYQFSDLIVNGVNHSGDPLGIQLDILEWVKVTTNVSNPSDATLLIGRFVELLFAFDLPTERFSYFLETVFLDGLYPAAWTTEWNNYISDPGSYESTVRGRLEVALRALMQSPEHQLF